MNEKKEQPIKMKTLKVSGILALVLVGALLFVGVMEGAVRLMENKLDFLEAGERWSADGSRFAVCALYQEREAAVPVDQALTWAHQIDTAAANLIDIKKQFEADPKGKLPAALCVLCGMSNAAYRRPDGVFVVPITALKM